MTRRQYPYDSLWKNRDHDKRRLVRGDHRPPEAVAHTRLTVPRSLLALVEVADEGIVLGDRVTGHGWVIRAAFEGFPHSYDRRVGPMDNSEFESSLTFAAVGDACDFVHAAQRAAKIGRNDDGTPRISTITLRVLPDRDTQSFPSARVGFDPELTDAITYLLTKELA